MMRKDEFWEFSEQVYDSMIHVLNEYNLGRTALYVSEGYYEKLTKVLIHCMSNTADGWYARGAHPRTIFFAVTINSIHEFLEKAELNEKNPKFWEELCEIVVTEREIIDKKVEELKPGDKVDVDVYHREIQERLDVIIH